MTTGHVAEPAHRLLREGTRDAHEATEASGGMRRLMDGDLDEAGYEALLASQLGLFEAWEAERGAWLAEVAPATGWHYASRAALLQADLLNVVAPVAPPAAPASRWPGTPADGAAAWGELYVIEGSALGGRLIVRRLRELYPHRAHRFYAVGENAPSAWRRFQQILDTQLSDAALQSAAIAGAQRMFARFRQTLSEPAVHV